VAEGRRNETQKVSLKKVNMPQLLIVYCFIGRCAVAAINILIFDRNDIQTINERMERIPMVTAGFIECCLIALFE